MGMIGIRMIGIDGIGIRIVIIWIIIEIIGCIIFVIIEYAKSLKERPIHIPIDAARIELGFEVKK